MNGTKEDSNKEDQSEGSHLNEEFVVLNLLCFEFFYIIILREKKPIYNTKEIEIRVLNVLAG